MCRPAQLSMLSLSFLLSVCFALSITLIGGGIFSKPAVADLSQTVLRPNNLQTVLHPNNPQVSEQLIYLSSQGISAYQRQDGRLLWQVLGRLDTLQPLIYKHWLLVGSNDGLQVLARDTGDVQWRLGQGTTYTPVVAGSTAFLSARHGEISALDLDTQQVLWREQLSEPLYPPAWVHLASQGQRVSSQGWMLVANAVGDLWGLDPTTGSVVWSRALGFAVLAAPQPGSEWLFVLSKQGQLLALNPLDGSTVWQVMLEERSDHQPILARGNLYIARVDGVLEIVSQSSGRTLWLQQIHEQDIHQPVLHQDVVSIYDNSGRITYFELATHQFKQLEIPGISLMTPWVMQRTVFWQPSESSLRFKSVP